MTTLWTSDRIPVNTSLPVLTLHEWLQGSWALLFSDPEDFAPQQGTPHGFMARIADELRRADTKALALARDAEPAQGWLRQATEQHAIVVLRPDAGRIVDFTARSLTRVLEKLEPPFVLVLDELGRCRSTISYRPRRIDRVHTVQELLSVVAALRSYVSCSPLSQGSKKAAGQ